MDPYTQSYMIFTIIMTIVIGGFIVTFPIMRRLGRVMEEMLRERQEARLASRESGRLEVGIDELRASMERVEGHVALLSERQDFMENLLSRREPGRLPEGEDWRRP
jgi:hypothetical protein